MYDKFGTAFESVRQMQAFLSDQLRNKHAFVMLVNNKAYSANLQPVSEERRQVIKEINMTASSSCCTLERSGTKQVHEQRVELKRYLQDKAEAFDSQKRNNNAISSQSAFKQSLF